jgi:Protein of unknown function (DUF4065)
VNAALGSVSAFASTPDREHLAFDYERVAAVVHYVIARAPPGRLGHVRLGTILWYSDIEHYRHAGVSITGLTQYQRTTHGPFAVAITKTVGALARLGKVSEHFVEVDGYTRRDMISLQEPNRSMLNATQIGILDRITDAITTLTASRLMQAIAADPLWQETQPGDALVIATGSIVIPTEQIAAPAVGPRSERE